MKIIIFKVETVKEIPNDIHLKEDIRQMVEENAEICVEITDIEKVFNISCKDGETVYINDDTINIKNDKMFVLNNNRYEYDCLDIAWKVLLKINSNYYECKRNKKRNV